MSSSVVAGIKATLDTFVTVVLGVAAVVLVWRALSPPTRSEASGRPPSVEQVESERLSTALASEPTVGTRTAPVVVIEYSDFECPFCARYSADTYPKIEKNFLGTGRVQYVFRNFPMERIHPSALPAAEAARCAHREGEHLEMREYLFAHGRALGISNWADVASTLGLSVSRFTHCMSNHSALNEVEAEKRDAARFGVKSTPTFLFGRKLPNGEVQITSRLLGAAPYDVFKDELDRLVAAN